MKRQALLLTGMLALVGACVVNNPAVLDAGGDGDDDDDDDDGTEGYEDDGTDAVDPDPSDTGDEPDLPDPEPEPMPHDGDGCAQKLDILLVVDNSGSMGPFQRQVTDSVPLLIDGLDQASVDWRLAVTTTDSGNLWCQGSTPEHGSFVFSSCKSRIDDFVFGGNAIDVQDIACNEVCNLSPEQLEALPTATDGDPLAQPRPWLQREAGQLNLPVGVDAADALRCLIPQGINGCGFEQQLESMRGALARTTNPGLPEAGFLRDDASLLVLLVTDEVDCSIRPEFEQQILGDDSDKVFWSDPSANFPTSAVCWNAGVDCSGDPSSYDDCVAANKDVLGSPTGPLESVLYPVSRYANTLEAIEQSKRAIDPGLDVTVLSINGVGLDGTITYADTMEQSFQDAFGIGPGCTGPELGFDEIGTALPPVRIRELAGQLSTDPFGSICADDYDDFMLAALARFVDGC
jgi:hypothetical protein